MPIEIDPMIPDNGMKKREAENSRGVRMPEGMQPMPAAREDKLTIGRVFEFIFDYFVNDIFKPAAGNFIVDAAHNATDSMEKYVRQTIGGSTPGRRDDVPGRRQTNYNSISDGPPSRQRMTMLNRGFRSPEFDDAASAQDVINRMNDCIRDGYFCSVSMVYQYSNVTCDWAQKNWGWYEQIDPTTGVDGPFRRSDGTRYYILNLPQPKHIDNYK